MKCLCCNKPISPNASPSELKTSWHDSCVKKFFGTQALPKLDISAENLNLLATESTSKGYTTPGVQKKLSLNLSVGNSPKLTIINYPTGYILKPQTEEYASLPEAEYLVMLMAKATGIKTVPFALIKTNSEEETLSYITKRIDRINKKNAPTELLAMEDFCQLEERLTVDKYKGSYEQCAKTVVKYSSLTGFDLSELFLRLVFSYAVGNSDMHLKNFSLIETSPKSKKYALSAAYDLLPVNLILPADKEQFALSMNGKKNNLRKSDFLKFASAIGLSEKVAKTLISTVTNKEGEYLALCEDSYLPSTMKAEFKSLISSRIENLI